MSNYDQLAGEGRLVVSDLWKAYLREPVLCGLSFSVLPGEILGICGANGVGKTTLLSIIASILPPDRGEISLLGIPVRQKHAYRRMVGYVPQNIALSPRLTIQQNLLFWSALAGLKGPARMQAAAWAADLAGAADFLNKPIGRCSGGMARRANLAAGLVGQPKLILLDEPTAGIDSDSRESILDSIRALKQQGCIILMVNHYYNELERICDRIITLRQGQIAEEGAYAL